MTQEIATKETIEETLAVCRSIILADDLFQSCAQDDLPVSYHQAQGVEAMSRECIEAGGFYIMLPKANDKGHLINFFDNQGNFTKGINVTRPEVSKDRKIPKLNWMKQLFASIGYAPDSVQIKLTHKLVESHLRDGGSWNVTVNDDTIVIILKMNDIIKAHYEFHEEVFVGEH